MREVRKKEGKQVSLRTGHKLGDKKQLDGLEQVASRRRGERN